MENAIATPELQSLQSRIALVTGANTGIGWATALGLARLGAEVFIATRSAAKTQAVLDEIKAGGGEAEWLALDLGDLASVRACATAFLAMDLPLHLLVNNAGLGGARGLTASPRAGWPHRDCAHTVRAVRV